MPVGALKWKKAAEERLKASGLPYTIVRPGRLMDGPFTSYDVNTLLQSTSGLRREVQISAQDDQMEEASRISVAGKLEGSHHLTRLLSLPRTVAWWL